MSETKLSSDEVPAKFADWLLAMGCPPEKVPTVDKISQMCRGTYYLVWRSLMEQVESKDIIKQKRLQVFADDVRRCKKKNLFTEHDTNVLMPPELTLWRQQTEVRQKVVEAEARVAEAKRDLIEIMDKVSSKISQRNLARERVQDLQRRGWLLQLLAEDLRTKKQSLIEARAIAEEMCAVQDHTDVQPKLDRCLSSQRRQPAAVAATVASSTMISNSSTSTANNGDLEEEHISQLVACRGDALWAELYARRAALVNSLSRGEPTVDNNRGAYKSASGVSQRRTVGGAIQEHISQLVACRGDALWAELYARRAALVNALSRGEPTVDNNRPSFQAVLSETAALQCTLTLEAFKCREMTRFAQQRLAQAVDALNTQLTGESCELLVLRCERARTEARVLALRDALRQVTEAEGLFATSRAEPQPAHNQIYKIDKAIESKREEIKSVTSSLASTERKMQNVRECLTTIFNGFRNDAPDANISHARGLQLDLPSESIASLRQFYEKRRSRAKMELSMEFDVSDNSFNDLSDLGNARFIDELRIYLKKFNLEKNRKLVLESGEKIWVFETLRSAASRLQARWLTADIASGLTCPSQSLPHNVLSLVKAVGLKARLRSVGQSEIDLNVNVDINKHIDEEDQIIDKIKKRLDENLRSLQKTVKTLEQGKENLSLWSDNQFKNHMSQQRTVDGKPYKAYEAYYLEALSF
ncbi:uncharacterized protein LOC134674209 [Cydia fagiglandana]|uniref:uncharacterized protein LOC134674209 n=1 Tax=Cydia fagiglandana TaxID=1458189 RepID=UPI002FEE44BA